MPQKIILITLKIITSISKRSASQKTFFLTSEPLPRLRSMFTSFRLYRMFMYRFYILYKFPDPHVFHNNIIGLAHGGIAHSTYSYYTNEYQKYAFNNKRDDVHSTKPKWTAMNEFLSFSNRALYFHLRYYTSGAASQHASAFTLENYGGEWMEIFASLIPLYAPTRVRRTVFGCNIFAGFVYCIYKIVCSTIWHRCLVVSLYKYIHKMNCISRHRQRHNSELRFIGTHVRILST